MLIKYIYGSLAIMLSFFALFLNRDRDPSSFLIFLALFSVGLFFIIGKVELDLAWFGIIFSLPIAVFSIVLLRKNLVEISLLVILSLVVSVCVGLMIHAPRVQWFVFFILFLSMVLGIRLFLIAVLALSISLFLTSFYFYVGEILLAVLSNILAIYVLVALINNARSESPNGFENEVFRKLTHLGALILVPFFVQKDFLVKVFSVFGVLGIEGLSEFDFINQLVLSLGIPILLVFFFVEYLRIYKGVSVLPTKLLRRFEMDHLAAYIYTITALILVAALFDQKVLVISALVGLLADAVAALVGKLYGEVRITNIRTLEGTVAGFLTAFILTFVLTMNPLEAFLVGVVLEIFDILNVKGINDNMPYIFLTALVIAVI